MSKRRYAVHKVTIGANQSEKVTIRGNVVACIEAPTAFLLGFGDDTPSLFYQGFSVKADEGEIFDYIRVENETGAPIEITLAVGFGDIRDSRLSLTGVLQANIINWPPPVDPWSWELKSSDIQINTYNGGITNQTAIAAVDNVNGVLVKRCYLGMRPGGAGQVSVKAGANYLIYRDAGSGWDMQLPDPAKIEAGVDVIVNAASSSCFMHLLLEKL